MKKPLYGVGINDADYFISKSALIDGKWKTIWTCPLYSRWSSMITRCYSNKSHSKRPTYLDCSVTPEWHYFMTFRAWMETQDWEDKELDKDILFPGNKVYSPHNCVFVDKKVNLFLTERQNGRGDWPLGVSFYKRNGKYLSCCSDVTTNKIKNLGYFLSAEEAHWAWLTFKLGQAKILAAEQSDERIARALIERYENYTID